MIGQLLAAAPPAQASFYRTSHGADVAATLKLLIDPVASGYPLRDGIEVMNTLEATAQLAAKAI